MAVAGSLVAISGVNAVTSDTRRAWHSNEARYSKVEESGSQLPACDALISWYACKPFSAAPTLMQPRR